MDIPQIPNLIHYAIPAFIFLIALEIIISVRMHLKTYLFKDAATSITMGIGNVLIGLVSKSMVYAIMYFIYAHYRLFNISFAWYYWIVLLFAEDFTYYWFHRISHTSRFFWASHIIHHSSQHYNLSTALRQTWTGSFTSFVFWLWLPLIGFHPLMIMTQMSISLLFQFWIHTKTINKLPKWFEAIFNTPSHHRVHHATNPQYLDRNHAGIFIIWDKLFGTFEPEVEKPIYGLTKNIDSFNPFYVAFHEWIALFKSIFTTKTNLAKRFLFLVKPPGWLPDGKGQLSSDLRKAWENGKQ